MQQGLRPMAWVADSTSQSMTHPRNHCLPKGPVITNDKPLPLGHRQDWPRGSSIQNGCLNGDLNVDTQWSCKFGLSTNGP